MLKTNLEIKHLIEPKDLSLEELNDIFELSNQIIENPKEYQDLCKGRILATLFYEPSTRTRLSFETAMLRLGGQVIGFSDAKASSVSKGESIRDTIQTVGCYADVIAMRHPLEGASKLASMFSQVPVINAGDGGHQHPTQTLTDLLTIKTIKGNLNGNTIALCGDLKHGRTVHSLIKALSRFENNKFVLISPEELKLPNYIKEDVLEANNIEYIEIDKLEDGIKNADILYMTRIQQERFESKEEYEKLKGIYILDEEKMTLAKDDMIVLHPLPRVNEISYEVDNDERAKYFVQAKMGMYVRMALIAKLLGVA
ncbi:aspartate carbamoyltransferase [uncultured Clostridium sp.]|jgi:aspartate carbamoyltransferase catalytic subunit|uniref:aspartate carbamoyltransferase n=1 Tax=uncultured Clostridium sp. TaxID=59620 RepID=UPI0026399848|nr:aspartate carbamoyltransferase [uncultured Clostridium sp.]